MYYVYLSPQKDRSTRMCVPWGLSLALLDTFEALKLKEGKLNHLFSELLRTCCFPGLRFAPIRRCDHSICVILGLNLKASTHRGLTGNILSLCYNSERYGVKLHYRPASVCRDPFVYHSIIPPVEYLTLPSHYPCCHDLDKVTFSLPDLCVLIHNIIYCVIPPSAINRRMPVFPFWVSGYFFIYPRSAVSLRRRTYGCCVAEPREKLLTLLFLTQMKATGMVHSPGVSAASWRTKATPRSHDQQHWLPQHLREGAKWRRNTWLNMRGDKSCVLC